MNAENDRPDGFDDGTDARSDFRGRGQASGEDRKLRQLCSQVQRALSTTLCGECGDPVLQNLFVESVTPSPNANRLRVTLSNPDPAIAAADVAVHVEHAAGLLRRAVGDAIHRRKVPELAFEVVQADPGS